MAAYLQMFVRRLFGKHKILIQICGNDFHVLEVASPLVGQESSFDRCAAAMQDVIDEIHSSRGFWSEARGLAARARQV